MEKRKITIKGPKVHDVGYRPFLFETAEALHITNFNARNIKGEPDAIEVLVGGDSEKIKAFVKYTRENIPQEAEVTEITVDDYKGEIRSIDDFYRTFSASQLSKIAQTGLALLKTTKQGFTDVLTRQDTMLEKQDTMLEKQDATLDKMDQMLEKQDATIQTIKDEGEKTRKALGEHLVRDIGRLYEEIDEIKTTLARVVEKVGA
jgi:acylphosphatase